MKTLILILKGLLLWTCPPLVTLIWICGLDSIVEQGYFIPYTFLMLLLILLSYRTISYREFLILSLDRFFTRLIEK